MKIYSEQSLADFKFWSGAENTAQRIWEELGREGFDQLEAILEDLYPDGIDETELNDLLWFEDKTIYEWLGIGDEENEEDDEDAGEEKQNETTNDYVINAGRSWDNLTPVDTAASKEEAIAAAKLLFSKCAEVVYSPCDDVGTNEVVWRNQN